MILWHPCLNTFKRVIHDPSPLVLYLLSSLPSPSWSASRPLSTRSSRIRIVRSWSRSRSIRSPSMDSSSAAPGPPSTNTSAKVDTAPTTPACDQCRSRKIRCDRQSPECFNCRKAGVSCGFSNRGKRVNQTRQLCVPSCMARSCYRLIPTCIG